MPGLYIHIPFCRQLCHYCDFYSRISLAKKGEVLEALLCEMALQRDFLSGDSLTTIYLGGGTPSVYTPQELGQLPGLARELWDCTALREVTVEVNPDDLTPDYCEGLLRQGFNRISMGVQSFIDRDLRWMNRRHTAQGARQAVADAKRAGFENLTIDLIYGIPGMSDAEWEYNLEQALELDVPHISAYHLTIEPKTVLGKKMERGEFAPVDEETSQRQYLTLHRTFTQAGYDHYEISNFARPGYRARHNSAYWTGEPYLGLGPSAHSYDGNIRRWCPPSINGYLTGVKEGKIYESETLTEDQRYDEYVMTALRTAEGVNTEALSDRFGAHKLQYFGRAAERFIRTGTLIREGAFYRIPPEEFLVADQVIATLFFV